MKHEVALDSQRKIPIRGLPICALEKAQTLSDVRYIVLE